LSDVDFKVFRRMTKFDWVDSEAARERLGHRFGRGRRVCNAFELRTMLRDQAPNLINKNESDFGIPQGTPLSGLYANISMATFDGEMTLIAQRMGGSYRRYSDDVALLIPTSEGPAVAIDAIREALKNYGLELSEGKTDISVFNRQHGNLQATKPFQYLGFTFDGARTLVRPSSLNRYYSKMNRGIRAKIHAAKRNNVDRDQIYLRELFKKYTHFGKYRNFPRYVYRSAHIHNAPEMRKQISRHMDIFKRMLSKAIDDIY
jgi:RNA-directed DNA polymerase